MNQSPGIGPLIWQRLLISWRLVGVLAFGVVVAAVLLAIAPVYTRVMNDLGLESALTKQIGNASRNGIVRHDLVFGDPASTVEARTLTGMLSDELSWLTASETRYAALNNLTLVYQGRIPPESVVAVSMQTGTEFNDHVHVTKGRLPRPTTDPSKIEAVVPAEAARFLGLEVNQPIEGVQVLNDCAALPPTQDAAENRERARFRCQPNASTSLRVGVTVVGFVERNDIFDGYWAAVPVSFDAPAPTEISPPMIPTVVPEETFYKALPSLVSGVPYQFRVHSFADITRLSYANLDSTRATLERLRNRLLDRGAEPDLAMQNQLESFSTRASFNQIPLLILLLQVVGIAVYYVMLVATLLTERRAEETAVLRSRGATVVQVVALAAGEALILGLIAAVLAPFLASGVVAALGKTGTFESISGGGFLPFTLVPSSFFFALGGAALAVVAVIVPAFFAARKGMVLFLRDSARPGKPILQRYYLDLALAGLAALGLWEMNQRGSVFDPESVGGWSADPLLLVSPFLLIMATGALMFRFLPPILRIVTGIVTATAGPGVTLGLWQLARSPARYTQLALLVVMAAAVGVFAATYGETTDRSQEERALFEAGADVRFQGLDVRRSETVQLQKDLASAPGVEASATAYRGAFSIGPLPDQGARVPVLGVDPESAGSLLWYRPDFADEDLGVLIRRLGGSPAGSAGLVLPGEPAGFSAWVNPSPARPGMSIWVRSVDARGTFRMHQLGPLDFEGYRRLETRFDPAREVIAYPLSIAAIVLTQGSSVNDQPGLFNLDDVATIDVSGAETVVDDFEGTTHWDVIRTATRARDQLRQVSQPHRGTGALQYAFRLGVQVPMRGIYYGDPNIPVPALVSSRLLKATGLQPGKELELVVDDVVVPLSIQGEVHLFPTMEDSDPGFVIVNQKHLYYYTGVTNQTAASGPTEVWLTLPKEPAARAEALNTVATRFANKPTQTTNSEDVLGTIRTDPIVRAGGSGILLVALLAAFAILALGFGLTLYLGGQQRTVEVSVLRAVGLSPRQIFVMIGLEYLLVAAIGLVIGTIAGLRISETMLSFLNVTEAGKRVVPPFSLATRWDTVAIAFLVTAGAFLTGVVGLTLYFLRMPVSRILRLTR